MAYGNNTIFDDIKKEFLQSDNMVTRLIAINVIVWASVNIIQLFDFLFQTEGLMYAFLINKLTLQTYLPDFIFEPWTLVTYMFLHEDFWHLLMNMLWLYWLGSLVKDYVGNKMILPIYVFGGIAGGLLYMLAYNTLPVFNEVVQFANNRGASAGVMAIVFAAATLLPNHQIKLILLPPISLKWFALIFVMIDLFGIAKGNAGGHIAHLGGAMLGFLFIRQRQAGNDWSKGFNNFLDHISAAFSSRPKPKVAYRRPKNAPKPQSKKSGVNQESVDKILEKISESGYDSLTSAEKEVLFRASKDK